MSWRLPPRSSRWRWCLPELASSGATPAWRASWASVSKRSIGPISPSSFAALNGAAAGQLEQRGRGLCSIRAWSSRSRARIVRVRLRQRPRSSRAIWTWTVCSLRASRRASRSSQIVPVERTRGDGRSGSSSCRCQRNRCCALLRSSTRSSRWSMSSFSSRSRSSPGRGSIEARLSERRSGDRERVDRVGLAALPAGAPCGAISFGGTRTSRSPALDECPLEPAGQLAAVLHRPEPLLLSDGRPLE